MISDVISTTLDALLSPARNEFQRAQQQAMERIQRALQKAEDEIASTAQLMNQEQRLQAAEKELVKTEDYLLLALGSMFKAFRYATPQADQLFYGMSAKLLKTNASETVNSSSSKQYFGNEKEVTGEVIDN
jgi:hypothetical protein